MKMGVGGRRMGVGERRVWSRSGWRVRMGVGGRRMGVGGWRVGVGGRRMEGEDGSGRNFQG